MQKYLISLYIDNELDLDEKLDFVDAIAADRTFHQETCCLIEQEKMLRGNMVLSAPPAPTISLARRFSMTRHTWRPALVGFGAALVLLAAILHLYMPPTQIAITSSPHRFVLYLPDVKEAAIVGTFTGWSPVPMEQVGNTGYWSLDINLQPGEHRYSYLVEDKTLIADPTVRKKEYDDFGGANSIITIGTSA